MLEKVSTYILHLLFNYITKQPMEIIETAIFDYIEEQYTETELNAYDRSQIMVGVLDGIEDYIQQFK